MAASCDRFFLSLDSPPNGTGRCNKMPDHEREKDTGAWLMARQMGAMLHKNFLLKKADWRQTLAEVCCVSHYSLHLE